MLKFVGLAAAVLIAVAGFHYASVAQAPAPAFEKKQYNYGDWTKGRFSEVVTVTGPGKMIFVAGTGPEQEMTGAIQFKDNFLE